MLHVDLVARALGRVVSWSALVLMITQAGCSGSTTTPGTGADAGPDAGAGGTLAGTWDIIGTTNVRASGTLTWAPDSMSLTYGPDAKTGTLQFSGDAGTATLTSEGQVNITRNSAALLNTGAIPALLGGTWTITTTKGTTCTFLAVVHLRLEHCVGPPSDPNPTTST